MQNRRLEAGSREEVMQQVRDKDRLRQEIMGKAAQFEDAVDYYSGEEDESSNKLDNDQDEDLEDDCDAENPKLLGTLPFRKRTIQQDSYIDSGDDNDNDKEEKTDEVDEIFADSEQPLGDKHMIGRRRFAPVNPLNKPEDVVSETIIVTSNNPSKNKKQILKKNKQEKPTKLENLFAAEDDDQEGLDEKTKEQLDVIRRAFAEDKVFKQFEAKKIAEVEQDTPKDVDLTLPGWGAWGGIGIAPAKGKVILKKKDGIDPKKRLDAKLANVIIHEKRSKKSLKLMVDKVPYPFKTREEYERSLKNPIGKEWNCATNFKKKITPRVQVRVGSIIDPIKFTKNK